MALCVLVQATRAAAPLPQAESLLARADRLRSVDHPQFLRLLRQLQAEAPRLTTRQRWHLRYLEAAQTGYQGDYAKADAQMREIINHSGDMTLNAKASASLMLFLGLNQQYEEAFALANQWVADLPRIKDQRARYTVLYYAAQLLGLAGQNDVAIKYVHMMEHELPPGDSLCVPRSVEITVLFNSKKLNPADPLLQQAIDTCQAAKRPIFVNNIRLVLASLYLEKNRPRNALALLKGIAASIRHTQYYSHMLSHKAELATAYWKLGDDANAMKVALAAVAMSSPGDIDESLRDAYEVLYRVEKKRGHAGTALSYYEHYVTQDKGYLDDVSARALAYQVVQQRILAKKFENEELSKQNNILRLQQALDAKAMETSRLYIFILLAMIASIALWLCRLKRSQLRFMKLSRHDSLTGILNHQHFISGAERLLHGLQRRLGHACLVSIDLDHFKQVNDNHGHAMGDAVLQRTVAICQQQLRPTDLFGRLGGEEFGILLHDCTRAQGVDIADRIRMAIEATPMEKDGCAVSVSASVGLACTDTAGHELHQLYKEADAALYRAKRAGRNRVIAHNGSLAKA